MIFARLTVHMMMMISYETLPQVDCAHDDCPAKGSPGLLTAAGGQDSRAASGCQEVTHNNTNKY